MNNQNTVETDGLLARFKVYTLAAGFILSLISIPVFALIASPNNPYATEVIGTLSACTFGTGAALGLIRIGDIVSEIMNTRTLSQAPYLVPMAVKGTVVGPVKPPQVLQVLPTEAQQPNSPAVDTPPVKEIS